MHLTECNALKKTSHERSNILQEKNESNQTKQNKNITKKASNIFSTGVNLHVFLKILPFNIA